MKRLVLLSFAVLLLVFLKACTKDAPIEITDNPSDLHTHDHSKEGSVRFEFSNVVGSSPLVLNDVEYLTPGNDPFRVSLFSYYISNIKLIGEDGSRYAEDESYHLIRHENNGSKIFTINTVPSGKYKELTLMIGVDSTRNVSGIQEGALDPVWGMFWSWNTGYIMAKLEGTSPAAGTGGNVFMYHPGGFQTKTGAVVQVTLPLGNMEVKAGQTRTIKLNADVLEWFTSPHAINISAMPIVHNAGASSRKLAENYANMLTIKAVE